MSKKTWTSKKLSQNSFWPQHYYLVQNAKQFLWSRWASFIIQTEIMLFISQSYFKYSEIWKVLYKCNVLSEWEETQYSIKTSTPKHAKFQISFQWFISCVTLSKVWNLLEFSSEDNCKIDNMCTSLGCYCEDYRLLHLV